MTNALTNVTRYQYDEAGNQTNQIDALNRTNAYSYDGLGRRVRHAMPGGQSEEFAYDLAGNLTFYTNFNGVILTNQYDALNRLTNRHSMGGYQIGYTYTPTGQRATMADASGTTSYTYNNRDRLTQKIVTLDGGMVVMSLDYLYDANGNVTALWSGTVGGVTNVYQYDALSRLTVVQADGSAAAVYGYDTVGNLRTGTLGNGVTNLYQYDRLNRLTNAVWKLGTSPLASFYYQLGLTGNRTNMSETVHGTNLNYGWKYDPLYRLTNENISGGIGTIGYGYDLVGNRTNRASSITGLGNQTPTYNTNDWLTTDSYDSNGNTLSSTNGGITNGPYQYDPENHLTNYNGIAMVYNGDGLRVSKTVSGQTTYYLLDDRNPSGSAQVVEEWTSTGGPAALSRAYNYGTSLISQFVPGSSTNYFIYDGHGSTRALYDGAADFVNTFTYDAYGNLIGSNGAPQTVYLYCGQQYDSDLGLYYNRARYLNQNTGSFWTMDTHEGDQEDPLSLHKYVYVADNPVNRIDPSGHDDIGDLELGSELAAIGDPVFTVLGGTAGQHQGVGPLKPNWSSATGPITHTDTSVDITFPSGSAQNFADQIYADLRRFNYFNQNNNSSVAVNPPYAYFTPLGAWGNLSALINSRTVAVQLVDGPGNDQLGAVTLGNHMLVGIRRWRSTVESAHTVRVETEAYEQASNIGNLIGLAVGRGKQSEVWKTYMNNIATHWDGTVGATSGGVVSIPAQQVGSPNPWRSQLPASLQN